MALGGNQPIESFANDLKFPEGFMGRKAPDPHELDEAATAAVSWLESKRPPRQNYWPALTLALVGQIDTALTMASKDSDPDITRANYRQDTLADGEESKQLNLTLPGVEIVTTRPFYNKAESVIRNKMRRAHPSAAGHATASWRRYIDFIQLIGQTTPEGRRYIAEHIWNSGVLPSPETVISSERTRQPRPFWELVKNLPRGSGTTGGAIYQGIVYAYLTADSPTLSVQSQKVNVGSSRAGVVGDVNGYLGEDLVLAAEAKDKKLEGADHNDLIAFLEDAANFPDADAAVFARSISEETAHFLAEQGLRSITENQMLDTISLWDVPKQENAVRALRFFLGNIQKSARLLERVKTFLDSLYTESSAMPDSSITPSQLSIAIAAESTENDPDR